jgi:hypothetical protein
VSSDVHNTENLFVNTVSSDVHNKDNLTGWIFSWENSFGSTFKKVADFVNNFIDTSFSTIALTLVVHVRQQWLQFVQQRKPVCQYSE